MRFFFTQFLAPEWHATLGAAHECVRGTDPVYRADSLIEEIEVATDKDGIHALLLGSPQTTTTKRKWKVTSRGGLKEVTNREGIEE